MPVLDGIAAAERIARARIAPVVILTAFSQRELVERARDAGAMAYLVKPFTRSDLVPAIEIAVSRFAELGALEPRGRRPRPSSWPPARRSTGPRASSRRSSGSASPTRSAGSRRPPWTCAGRCARSPRASSSTASRAPDGPRRRLPSEPTHRRRHRFAKLVQHFAVSRGETHPPEMLACPASRQRRYAVRPFPDGGNTWLTSPTCGRSPRWRRRRTRADRMRQQQQQQHAASGWCRLRQLARSSPSWARPPATPALSARTWSAASSCALDKYNKAHADCKVDPQDLRLAGRPRQGDPARHPDRQRRLDRRPGRPRLLR